jgi:glucarate dehydratase
MRIATAEFFPISVPYTHRESSSQVNRDGVSDVIVKLTADNGLVGWGEACSGANIESVHEALKAFLPIVLGRDPWSREALWHDCFRKGIWHFREPTFNFAWPGIDLALWDLCGKAIGQPVYNLLGGLRRREVDYFYYLSYRDLDSLRAECRDAVARGYTTFYRKVGLDIEHEAEALMMVREAIGPRGRIRIDANEAWTVAEAERNIELLDRCKIDFAEQPVPAEPIENMIELRAKVRVPLASNEGLWRITNTWEVIKRRAADVLCFSPYWVGSLAQFHRLSHAAALEGLSVCKHTHGEVGIAAAACQHALLTLPRIVEGHQQTDTMMSDDILATRLPIASGPKWGVPEGAGLGVEVDEAKVRKYHAHYRERGQYLPYAIESMGKEDPGWKPRVL